MCLAVTSGRRGPAPISARWGAFATWTGVEFLVWGGYEGAGTPDERAAGDGAAYDPATGRWRRLADAVDDGVAPAYGGATVWTGTEMLVLGGFGGEAGRTSSRGAAAYAPLTDTWRRLPALPVDLGSAGLVGGVPTVTGRASAGDPHGIWQLTGSGWERIAHAPDGLGPEVVLVAGSRDLRLTDGRQLATGYDAATETWELVDLDVDDEVTADREGSLAAAEIADLTVVLDHDALSVFDSSPPIDIPLDRGSVLVPGGGRAVTLPSSALAPLEILDVLVHGEGRFTAVAPLAPRSRAATAASSDLLFLWGGADAANWPYGDGAVLELPLPTIEAVNAVPPRGHTGQRLFAVDGEFDGERLAETVTYQRGELRYLPPPAGVVPAVDAWQARQAYERTGTYVDALARSAGSQTLLALQQAYEARDGALIPAGEPRLVWVLRVLGYRDLVRGDRASIGAYETEVRAVIDATSGDPLFIASARVDPEPQLEPPG